MMFTPTQFSKRIRSFATQFSFLFFMAYAFSAAAQVDPKVVSEGKALFKSNCASCHNATADGTGPALKGVSARWEAAGDFKGKSGNQWLHEWIKNFNTPVGAGYAYAKDMANSRPVSYTHLDVYKRQDSICIIVFIEFHPLVVEPPSAEIADCLVKIFRQNHASIVFHYHAYYYFSFFGSYFHFF